MTITAVSDLEALEYGLQLYSKPIVGGDDLREARQLLGLSQEELAIKLGKKSASMICQAEATAKVKPIIVMAVQKLLSEKYSAMVAREIEETGLDPSIAMRLVQAQNQAQASALSSKDNATLKA